jgi:DNA-binding MarR family transcriptional regulator
MLLAVKGLPEGRKATISALAERLQLAHHSTVELVDRLVERGFIQRCRDEADQRQVLVRLTPQGEEVLRNLSLNIKPTRRLDTRTWAGRTQVRPLCTPTAAR